MGTAAPGLPGGYSGEADGEEAQDVAVAADGDQAIALVDDTRPASW
jgi:hypothetical protein